MLYKMALKRAFGVYVAPVEKKKKHEKETNILQMPLLNDMHSVLFYLY